VNSFYGLFKNKFVTQGEQHFSGESFRV
jgi:hypothetical protein